MNKKTGSLIFVIEGLPVLSDVFSLPGIHGLPQVRTSAGHQGGALSEKRESAYVLASKLMLAPSGPRMRAEPRSSLSGPSRGDPECQLS